MIVMKFGGSSLASPASIKRVASIVESALERNPVIVVSAFGDTTDHLFEILARAARGDSYLCWKALEDLKQYHFCLAEDLLGGVRMESIGCYLRQTFRDLHVRMLETCEGERPLTPELRDWVLSLGEQLSSRIVAAAFEELGLAASHLDARKIILTDSCFLNAVPQYWETYARIRWAIPPAAHTKTVVLGGFMGATEDGRTTTLGRGGSDFTASLVGAALNAEEIQFWKDVDGLLTWNPKIKAGGYRVRQLSYAEMSELAHAGATILHPDSIAPARRLRIPVVLRNTFHPECEGTKIGVSIRRQMPVVKSIACRTNITLLELRSPAASDDLSEYSVQLEQACKRQRAALNILSISQNLVCVALDSHARASELDFHPETCVEARVRNQCSIVTLVGEGIAAKHFLARMSEVLAFAEATILPVNAGSCGVHVAVQNEFLPTCLEALQRAFFSHVDPLQFAFADPLEIASQVESCRAQSLVFTPGTSFQTTPGQALFRGAM